MKEGDIKEYGIVHKKSIEELIEELQYLNNSLLNDFKQGNTQREEDIKRLGEIRDALSLLVGASKSILTSFESVKEQMKHSTTIQEENVKRYQEALNDAISLDDLKKSASKEIDTISLRYKALGVEVEKSIHSLNRITRFSIVKHILVSLLIGVGIGYLYAPLLRELLP